MGVLSWKYWTKRKFIRNREKYVYTATGGDGHSFNDSYDIETIITPIYRSRLESLVINSIKAGLICSLFVGSFLFCRGGHNKMQEIKKRKENELQIKIKRKENELMVKEIKRVSGMEDGDYINTKEEDSSIIYPDSYREQRKTKFMEELGIQYSKNAESRIIFFLIETPYGAEWMDLANKGLYGEISNKDLKQYLSNYGNFFGEIPSETLRQYFHKNVSRLNEISNSEIRGHFNKLVQD